MDGIKRIEEMLKGQKDKYLNIICNYLMKQTELDLLYLNEEKNLKDMAEYIKNNARKQSTGNVAVIEDEVVFNWAKEYFSKPNSELGIANVSNTKKEKIKSEEVDEFGSIFGNYTTAKSDVENEENIEQISFFAAA